MRLVNSKLLSTNGIVKFASGTGRHCQRNTEGSHECNQLRPSEIGWLGEEALERFLLL